MGWDETSLYTLTAGHTFPGRADQCREARIWARVRLRPFPDTADAVELVLSEFFSNAIRHSASGRPGGSVFVSLVGLVYGTIHLEVVDDGPLAARPKTVTRVMAPGADCRWDRGRGLFLAAALSKEWGRLPAEAPSSSLRDDMSSPASAGFGSPRPGDAPFGPMVTWAAFPTAFTRAGPTPPADRR